MEATSLLETSAQCTVPDHTAAHSIGLVFVTVLESPRCLRTAGDSRFLKCQYVLATWRRVLVLLTWLAGAVAVAIGWLPRRHGLLLYTASGDDLHQSLSAPSLLFLPRPPIRRKLISSSVFLYFFPSFLYPGTVSGTAVACVICEVRMQTAVCWLVTPCDLVGLLIAVYEGPFASVVRAQVNVLAAGPSGTLLRVSQWRDNPQLARASSLPRFHDHSQTHHSRWDSSGRVISPLQRPLPDSTQHSPETDICVYD